MFTEYWLLCGISVIQYSKSWIEFLQQVDNDHVPTMVLGMQYKEEGEIRC